MDVRLLDFGVKMRKVTISVISGCFRSVRSHPFLVGFLCFLLFLYRSFPFAFSLLVSASPVLVCTAVLLGTLLSFGQPNLPEIEKEEKTTHDIVSLKTGVSMNSTVVEKNESCSVERYDEKRRDEEENLKEHLSMGAGRISEVDGDDSFGESAPLIEERSLKGEWEKENKIIEVEQGESSDSRHEQERVMNEEKISNEKLTENHYAPIPNDEPLESDDDNSQAESFDSEKVNVDSLDSPPRSPWKRIEEVEDEEKEEDETLDSDSDTAESSSPDASMTDITPMLDELHPLLDEDAPQPVRLSSNGSDASSEHSPKSSTGSHESDDETENHKDLEVADDDNEDEDEAQGDKEEQRDSAITWTEEDQKNLMDLGCSELERNQRLENLIARRRARKNTSTLPERNLIDLESVDLPFNIAPISTRRHNPFDLPDDKSGLPPIPGSAPSILLPRRNPFDIPYDSSEEKPDLKGDDLKEELMAFQVKEPVFRRHESFNVGPSIFAPNRQEKQGTKLRPYFVPEGMILDEASSSRFQRQSSELSDSKVSSIPETESIASVGDLEDRKLAEEDISEPEVISKTEDVIEEVVSRDAEQISDIEETVEGDIPREREPEVISKTEDVIEEVVFRDVEYISDIKETVEDDIPRDLEPITKIEDVSEYVGHGSQSSEEAESLELDQVEKRDADIDELEIQLGHMQNRYEEGNVAVSEEVQATEFHSSAEATEQRYSSSSSSSSLSEVSDGIFMEKDGDSLPTLEGTRDPSPERRDMSTQLDTSPKRRDKSTQLSLESADLNIASASGGDNPFKIPVYDLSPQPSGKNFSLSSTSSDVHVESELALLPEVVNQSVALTEGESEGSGQEIKDSSANVEMSSEFTQLHQVNKSEAERKNLVDVKEHDTVDSYLSGVDQGQESSVKASMEENPSYQHGSYENAQGEVSGSSFDEDIHVMVHTVAEQTFKSSADIYMGQQEEEKHTLISDEAPVTQLNAPPFGIQSEEHSIDKEDAVRTPQEQLESSDSDVNFDVGFHQEAEEKLIASHYSEEKAISHSDDKLVFTDKSMNEQPFNRSNEVQEATHTLIESFEEQRFKGKSSNRDSDKLDSEIFSNVISIPSATREVKTSTCGEVENGEAISSHVNEQIMDDGLLSELDAVGDFNVDKYQSSFNQFDEHVDSLEESLPSPREATSTIEPLLLESEPRLDFEENNSSMAVVEARSVEDIEHLFKKLKSTTVETEAMVAELEVPQQGEVDKDPNSGVTEPEALAGGDIDLAFTQNSEREIEKSTEDTSPTDTNVELPILDVTLEKSHAAETITQEDINLEKKLKPNSEDGSAEVGEREVSLADKNAASSAKEDCVKEIKTVSSEELHSEAETPKSTSSTASVKDKEKSSPKSSSSSSSSSSSDSSDSDGE